MDNIEEIEKHLLIFKTEPVKDLDREETVLSLCPVPLKDELLTSWIWRIAQSNITGYNEIFRTLANIDYELMSNPPAKPLWEGDIDKNYTDLLMRVLIRRTKITKERFQELTLKKWDKNGINSMITGYTKEKNDRMKYCPLCLKEDEFPYYRRSWRLKFVTCCPVHRILLHDRCPT
ncbi:MAG: TniQ family protein [Promethearchaeota archaeon]